MSSEPTCVRTGGFPPLVTAVGLAGACALIVGLLVCAPAQFYMAPFREAQTAISVRAIVEDGSGAATYATPVLGAPWRIPLEYGLFQAVAAQVRPWFALEDQAGRFVSACCLLLCGWLVYALAREFQLKRDAAGWTAMLFLLTPVHLAYGTAYLIESMALGLALLHAWLGLRWLRTGGWLYFVGTTAVGVLAALVKGTTWASAAALLILAAVISVSKGGAKRRAVVLAGAVGVALCAGLVWLRYSDGIKELNPLASGLISANLSAWNYGTPAEKLSATVWFVILAKELFLLFGPAALLLPWLAWRAAGTKAGGVSLWLLGLAFLSGPVVFTNLHFRHQYYLWGNGVYLVLAVGLALANLPSGRLRKAMIWLLPLSAVSIAIGLTGLHRSLRNAREEAVIVALRAVQAPGPVALVNFDWSAFVPYYAGRRAMVLPGAPGDPVVRAALEKNRAAGYAAVVWIGGRGDAGARQIAEILLLGRGEQTIEVAPGIWMRAREVADASFVPSEAMARMAALRVELDHAARSGPLVLWRFRLAALIGPGTLFRCGLRRGDDLFYFDSHEGWLWRFSGFFEGRS